VYNLEIQLPYTLPHWLLCGIREVTYHGDNENGMGIGFNGIEDRDKEFIRGFVRDYSS